MGLRRTILIAVLGVLAGAAAYWHFSAPAVGVGRPVLGPAVEAVYATGVVEPVSWAKVASFVRGRIAGHCRCEGKEVAAGDVLARLDDAEQAALVHELEARETFLHKELERYRRLRQTNTVSAQSYERVDSEHQSIHAAIAAARGRLRDFTIKAPIDSVVLRRDGEVGEIAEAGRVLFWVGPPKPLWITAEVDEEDIPRIEVGHHTLIKADAFRGRDLEGRVERITPKGDPVNKSYRVRIALPDDTPLMIGMTTEINVVVREVADALLVPIDAVQDGRVFAFEQDRAVARALANDPSVLLADEPTGNLDTKNAELVTDIFRDLARSGERAVVMVTHNPDLAARADRRIHIVDGRVAEDSGRAA